MHRLLALSALLLAAAAPVGAGVLVAPTRLVFERGDRHGEFTLVNQGDTTRRYRIRLVERRMTGDGRIVAVEEPGPGERFASGMVRFSPRMVVLPPDEPQTIRVLVRRPGDLPAGEYRSHLLVEQVPEAPPAAPAPGSQPRGVSISIRPIYGMTMPLIVRQGELHARASLADLAVTHEGGGPRLQLRIQREGDRSVYGDFEVRHLVEGAEDRVVGRARGVAVYPPNPSRPFSMKLDFPGQRIPGQGRLVVEYRDAEASVPKLLAEAGVDLVAD